MATMDDEIKAAEKKVEELRRKKAQEEKEKPITRAELAAMLKDLQQPKKELPKFDIDDVPKSPKNLKMEAKPKEELYSKIPKKTCAAEVYNNLKTFKVYLIGGVVSLFLVLIASTFNMFAGSLVTGVSVIAGVLYLKKIQGELKRLKTEYRL